MKRLLNKEIRLAASPLSFIFLAAAGFTMIPGYVILVGAFFICLGIFQSFRNAREVNDVLYTVLLPVKKRDFVNAKYAFTCMIELIGFTLMALLTILRMTLLSGSPAYINNAMMNATPLYLGFALLVFAVFNLFFVGGFFRTAYNIGLPFLIFGIVGFIIITIGEALHHFPGLEFLNVPSGEKIGIQLVILTVCAVIYILFTFISKNISVKRFERIDL